MNKRASLLVYVLGMMALLSAMFVLVFDKVKSSVAPKACDLENAQLRIDAYNALNAAIAVIEEYRYLDGGIFAAEQGWDLPLSENRIEFLSENKVLVSVSDESAKLSLPNANAEILSALFQTMDIPESDAIELADCFMDWVDSDSNPRLKGAETDDYDRNAPKPPNRNIRDFYELRFIKNFDKYFFDENGRENDNYKLFVQNTSLELFEKINVNTASAFIIESFYKKQDKELDASVIDAIKGVGVSVENGITWVRNFSDLQNRGVEFLSNGFACESSLLKISVKVSRGAAFFELCAYYGEEPKSSMSQTSTKRNSRTKGGSSGSRRRSGNSNSKVGAKILRISEYSSECY